MHPEDTPKQDHFAALREQRQNHLDEISRLSDLRDDLGLRLEANRVELNARQSAVEQIEAGLNEQSKAMPSAPAVPGAVVSGR